MAKTINPVDEPVSEYEISAVKDLVDVAFEGLDAAVEEFAALIAQRQADRAGRRQELVDRFDALRGGDTKLPKFTTTDAEKRGYAFMRNRVSDLIMTCPDQSSIDHMRSFMALAAKIFEA